MIYDTLVLSGGSIKGFSLLGAIQYIFEKVDKTHIKNFVGTSIGSMICYLLCIGYDPLEIIHKILKMNMLSKIGTKIDPLTILDNRGVIEFETVMNDFEKLTIEKHGKLFTLNTLYKELGVEFCAVSFNMTMNKKEILCKDNYPDLECLMAIRMSSSIPFVFNRCIYNDCIYIDGGVIDNFPIQVAKKLRGKIIGVVVQDPMNDSEDLDNFSNYLTRLIFLPIHHTTKRTIRRYNKIYDIIQISENKHFLNFSIGVPTIMDMFSVGYNSAKLYFKNKDYEYKNGY